MQNPLIIVLVVILAAVMILVAVGAVFLTRRLLAQQLPEPVQRRGRKNALICGIGVLAAVGLLTLVIRTILQSTLTESVLIAFGVFWFAVFTWFMVGWLVARSSAGPLLLDCGPHPTRGLFLFNAVFFLLFFGGGNLVGLLEEVNVFRIGGLLFGITCAVYNVVMASGRLQIRENGIWQFWSLLKWDRLQSFEWQGDSLMIQARTRVPGFGKGALPVPAEHRESIDALLKEHFTAGDVVRA